MSQKKMIKKGLVDVVDLIWRQWKEDREAIQDVYGTLKRITNTPQEFAINGQNLAKILELQSKQTNQILEFYKIADKNNKKDDDDSFSEKEKEELFEQIDEEKKRRKKKEK